MHHYLQGLFVSLFSIGFATYVSAQKINKQFDEMLNTQYPAHEPGAAALVAINGEITYHKAFGMANLELDVKNEINMVFEIGSITKQFTAVSILMLKEQGKLDLDDDITEFIEDYPTHGHHISIHHLLNHTSGIQSYTSLESWAKIWRQDYEALEFIDLFMNEPMEFAPGEAWNYNNSAYFILGYIIEKASGQTYEEFIEENIFQALGMNHSRYGSMSEVIENRAYGYQKDENYVNAEYLSLTQPGGAGSIMSTVGDLYIWNRAIRNNILISAESKALAFTPTTLNTGEIIHYGYGWGLNEINGSPTIEHSGGIFGYVTNAIYLPEEDVFVAIYSNCDCNGPGTISTKMAAMAINKPFPDQSKPMRLDTNILKKYVGVYEFEDGAIRTITLEDNQLYSQREGSSKFRIFATSTTLFSYDDTFSTIEFIEMGDKMEVIFSNRINKTKGVKTDRPIEVKTEIELEDEWLEKFIGVYELAPGFDIAVTLEESHLMTQATGQQKFEIFPESETLFFLKVVDAKLEFVENEAGVFDTIILYQGGREMKGKRKD